MNLCDYCKILECLHATERFENDVKIFKCPIYGILGKHSVNWSEKFINMYCIHKDIIMEINMILYVQTKS